MHRTPPRIVHPAPGTCAPPSKLLRPPPRTRLIKRVPQEHAKRRAGGLDLILVLCTHASLRQGRRVFRTRVRREPARPSESLRPRAQATGKDALCAHGRSSPGAVRCHRRAAERAGPPRAGRAAAPLRVLGRGERPGSRAPTARARAAGTRGAHPGAVGRAGAASERVRGRLQGAGNSRRAPARARKAGLPGRGRP